MQISVIVRSVGRPSLIHALRSIEQQGRDDVQVILVQADGPWSLDWRSPIQRPVRLVLPPQWPAPRAEAAAVGLAEVDTPWAMFLDDDDVLGPGHLDKLAMALQAHPEAVLAHTGVLGTAERDGEWQAHGPRFEGPFEPWQLLCGNRLPIHAGLFRWDRLRAAGVAIDTRFRVYEDWDFWLQVQAQGAFVAVPGLSAEYRMATQTAGPSTAVDHSGVEAARYGDEPYARLWGKWWGLAPRAWWVRVLEVAKEVGENRVAQRLSTALPHADPNDKVMAWQEVSVLLTTLDERLHQQERQHQAQQAQWQKEAVGLRATVTERDVELQARDRRLAEQSARLAELEQQLLEAQATGDAMRAAMQSVRAEHDVAQAAVRSLQHEVHELRHSTSWRVTWPLRQLGTLWRRLRQRPTRDRIARVLHATPLVPSAVVETLLPDPYLDWIARHGDPTAAEREVARQAVEDAQSQGQGPLISVLMPLYNPPMHFLQEAVESLRGQWWTQWELCAVDDGSTETSGYEWLRAQAQADPRIRVQRRECNGHIAVCSNDALALCTGRWVVLFDQDDRLAPEALWRVVQAERAHPTAGVIYSDEDKIDEEGRRSDPYFKPAFNLELFRSQNMISHLGAYRLDLVRQVGGFRPGYEGSQDHDLALRCIEQLDGATQVIHIPRVLYHWRIHRHSTARSADAKPYALINGLRAVQDHLQRTVPGARVEQHPEASFYRVRYPLPKDPPPVDVIIPTRDGHDLLDRTLHTLFERTRYPQMRVTVVDNGSTDEAALALMRRHEQAGRIRVLRDDRPFNFSALNNAAVAQTSAPLILLLNNDVEIIQPDWLDEMVAHIAKPKVGVVGARLWYPTGGLQHGGVVIGMGGVAGHLNLRLQRGQPGHFGRGILAQELSAVTAACLLTRREVYHSVGGLDQAHLTVAFNDVDYCLKVRRAGWTIVWTPFAELVHHESATRGSDMAEDKRRRFEGEVATMMARWPEAILNDPGFNPNLDLFQFVDPGPTQPRDREPRNANLPHGGASQP